MNTTLTIPQQINLIERLLEQDEKYRECSNKVPTGLYYSLTELPMFEANEMKIGILASAALCPELLEEYCYMAYEFPFMKGEQYINWKDMTFKIANRQDFMCYLWAVYLYCKED